MRYNAIIGSVFPYILASLYVNRKKLRSLNVGKSYIYQYNLISIVALAVMMISTLLLESAVITPDDLLPVIFALILIIVAVCLSNYRKVVLTMEENAMNKIQLEKNAMELDYNTKIEQNLKELRTLRHDMKNHLQLIDILASEGNLDKIHNYIHQINFELKQTQTIVSASTTISSLINAKMLLCEEYKIAFQPELDFGEIYVDDFSIITILGNLLDNAITAAKKVEQGYIKLNISQADTYLDITCTNNHCEHIIKKEGRFISSKPSIKSTYDNVNEQHNASQLHGLGIISLTNTAEKLGGNVHINYDDKTFTINVLIPNYAH